MTRRLLLVILVCCLTFVPACSFGTDYVIVNSSAAPIRVTYVIAASGIDPLLAAGRNVPSLKPVSKLGERDWNKLAASQFMYDPATGVVTVDVPPDQGLLIARGGDYNPNSKAINLIVREISIAGAGGELIFKGDTVRKAFVVVPKPFYRFGPPTLLTLTYN
jgi:hypothetical protein